MAEVLVGGTRVFARPDGIIQVVGVERRKQSLDDAKSVVSAIRSLAGERRVLMLLDITVTSGLETEAQRYYNQEGKQFADAIAVVTSSTIGRIIANFAIAANEGVLPMRLFNEVAPAVAWLHAHAKP